MRGFVITSETSVLRKNLNNYQQAKACWYMTVKLRGRKGKEMHGGENEGKEMHGK